MIVKVLIKFLQLANILIPGSLSITLIFCELLTLPLILLLGDLSDGLHLHPFCIIVSAILGPTSPLLAHVLTSNTP